MANADQGKKGSTLQSLFRGCFGCCTSSRSPSGSPAAQPGDISIELLPDLPPPHLPADCTPSPNATANGGALAEAQENGINDVVITSSLNSNSASFLAQPLVRPQSLPATTLSGGRPTRTRVSCRPLSASAFFGPPPSPPPTGPLPPLPAHARQRNTTNTSQAGASRRSGASQQTRSKQQKRSAQQAVDSQQQLNESLTIDSQRTGNSHQIVNSHDTSKSVQTDNSQQLSKQHSPKMESAILHPLPVISIGDYVTRHLLRNQPGPIVGALFGQQNGREVTVEHAYEVQTVVNGDQVTLEPGWFETRLEQMRLVHKDRTLDLVGWFTMTPRSGPGSHVVPIHNHILHYNESALLLGFHGEEIGKESVGGKLPITLYETAYEVDDAVKDVNTEGEGEDKEMKDGDSQLKLKFREIPFIVETHEAEMISMSSVAGGAANAASERVQEELLKLDMKGKGKGKAKQAATDDEKINPESAALSKENEEMIAALTTKANAIKMLKARIDLVTKYLQKLPSPYIEEVKAEVADCDRTEPSQTLLRLVQALVHRLNIVEPSDAEAFKNELLSEENDVDTIELLTELLNRVGDTRDIGKKFHAIETEKAHNSQRAAVYASQGSAYGHSQPTKGGRPGSLPSTGDLM
ncbi:hypothetical protein Daus18300_002809 [Diaporthe australafricana]|uniref:MPN domain-containing protein n=1 Tax=Diaporthe australafricana TaxID=127596 RepID=A0ABR3XKS2_9PEZI